MPYIFKKGRGKVGETGAKDISFPLTKDNLKTLLIELLNGTSNYSHQDFANLCSKHFVNIYSSEMDFEHFGIDDKTYEVINDVDTNWDIYLVNSYTIDQLKELNLSTVTLPEDWLKEWIKQLD
jgi:hypothetical protein